MNMETVMIASFNHVSFTVTDMNRAVSFWVDTLGFKIGSVSPRTGEWQGKVTGVPRAELLVAHLYGYGTHVEFIQYLSGLKGRERVEPNSPCAAHVCFDVKNIDDTWGRLLAAGATPQGELVLVDNGPVKGLKAGYLRDPNGILIELVESLS
jgi:catechol 2,3-dioxygenase-like lactoylglutathione lyase family enzyme